MIVMSEGLLLNSKSIEMGGEEGGLQEFTKCVAVFILFNRKFVTFCSWGKPELIFQASVISNNFIKQHRLASLKSRFSALHCNACVACQGKNRS